jgi:hypothetical protein
VIQGSRSSWSAAENKPYRDCDFDCDQDRHGVAQLVSFMYQNTSVVTEMNVDASNDVLAC